MKNKKWKKLPTRSKQLIKGIYELENTIASAGRCISKNTSDKENKKIFDEFRRAQDKLHAVANIMFYR